jgi:hypothetical protein
VNAKMVLRMIARARQWNMFFAIHSRVRHGRLGFGWENGQFDPILILALVRLEFMHKKLWRGEHKNEKKVKWGEYFCGLLGLLLGLNGYVPISGYF